MPELTPERTPQLPRHEAAPVSTEHRESDVERGRGTAERPKSPLEIRYAQTTAKTAAPAGPLRSKDPELQTIENILAEGMDVFFKSLTPSHQLDFKKHGEEAATKIKQLVHKGKYTVRDIIAVIIGWLRTLPGINKFFLEQEAKIKADKIIRYYDS